MTISGQRLWSPWTRVSFRGARRVRRCFSPGHRPQARPALDILEGRCLPATFAGAGPTLTITMDHTGEAIQIVSKGATFEVTSNFDAVESGGDPTDGHVSGFGTTTADVDGGAYAQVAIQDTSPGTAVTFADSGANAYTAGFTVTLDQDQGVLFTGSSTFSQAGLTIDADGAVTTAAGSSLDLPGTDENLSLSSTADAIRLSGSIACGGETTLASEGGPLSLGVVQASELVATAAGFITQTGPVTAGTASFTAQGDYGIALSDPGNAITTVSLNNPGADATAPSAIDFVNGGTVILGDCEPGLGTFSIKSEDGDVDQSGAITQPVGAGAVTITAGGTTIDLGNANDISGGVALNGDGVTSITFQNSDTQATMPDPSGFPSTLQNLTLTFDNAPAELPSLSVLNNLTVTANGVYSASKTSILNVPGTADFDGGVYGVSLGFSGNVDNQSRFGTLELTSTGQAGDNVFAAGNTMFGNINVGSGGLALVVVNGAITQSPGSAITHTNGLTTVIYGQNGVDLSSPTNDIPGTLTLLDPSGNFPSVVAGDVTIDASSDLHLNIIETSGNLTVDATGGEVRAQQLDVMGNTSISSTDAKGPQTIDLFQAANAFLGSVSLFGSDVSLAAASGVMLGNCTASSLTVSANQGMLLPPPGFSEGNITQAPGTSLAVDQASFDSGGFATIVTIASAAQAPGLVSLVTLGLQTGSAAALQSTITAEGGLSLADIAVAGGNLTILAAGSITQATGTSITQDGTGTISLYAEGGTQNVDLDSTAGNTFSAPLTVQGADVTISLADRSTLTFSPESTINGALDVSGGGAFTIPAGSGAFEVGSLDSSATSTTIESDLTTTAGSVEFEKPVSFAGDSGLTIQTAGDSTVTFDDTVDSTVALTFDTDTGGVTLNGGTWDQGTNALTFSGTLDLKTTSSSAATLQLAGGSVVTFNPTSTGSVLTVEADSTLDVIGGPSPVTLANGGDIVFDTGARLGVDFASSANLDATGTGKVSIACALLIGSGLASSQPTAVLEAASRIEGQFTGSSSGPFLAESDIVTATYGGSTNGPITSVSIAEGGDVAPDGIATGTLSSGDQYQVQASLGASADLVVISDGTLIDMVVRDNSSTSTTSSTLTISATTTGGAATSVDAGGIVVYGNTNVTIQASGTDLVGDLLVNPGDDSDQAGTLAGLTLGDATGSDVVHPLLIEAGGPPSATTSITGQAFQGVAIEVDGVLGLLSLVSFDAAAGGPVSSASAQSFGTIGIDTTLDARLSAVDSSQAIDTVTVGGTLSNVWEISGGIGSISAVQAANWTLADSDGAVSQLELTAGALNSTVVAGSIGTLDALSWTGGELDFGTLADGSIGAGGLLGMDLKGHAANAAVVQKLVVTGAVVQSNLTFAGGPVQLLQLDGDWDGSEFVADTIGTLTIQGDVESYTQGSTTTQSTFSVAQNGTGQVVDQFQVVGQFIGSTLEVHNGDVGSLLFGGLVSSDSAISVDTGNIGQITLTAGIMDSSITAGNTISALESGPWVSSSVNAYLFGTFRVDGDLGSTSGSTSHVTSNANIGGPAAPISFTSIVVAGNIINTDLTGRQGIGVLTVGVGSIGGLVSDSSIVVDNTDSDEFQVGEIQNMTVGSLQDGTIIDANSLGTVVISGDVDSSNVFIGARGGAGVTPSLAVLSLTVAGNWMNTPFLTGLGLGSVTIDGVVQDSTITVSSGPVESFTAGEWLGSQLWADTIGTFQVRGNAGLGLPGNFTADGEMPSVLSVTSAGGSIANFEVDGNLEGSLVNVLPSVQTFRVLGNVQKDVLAIAYASGSSIGILDAGVWQLSNLTTFGVGQWHVSGDLIGSLINILGSAGGTMALGAFSAGGAVEQSTFQVAAGDVGSFVAGQFDQSALLAGYRLPRPFDISASPVPESLYWTANLAIHQFETTGSSPSFVQSNVAAATLGDVTLSGVALAVPAPTMAYGVLFRQSAGPGGPIEVGGQTVFPGYQDGQFDYVGQGATLTAVTVPAVAASAGGSTVLTAFVTSAGGPPPAGMLTFSVFDAMNIDVASGTVAVGPGGSGSVSIVTPGPGNYRLVVTYGGSGAFSTSEGIGSLAVAAPAPAAPPALPTPPALVAVGSRPGAPNVVRVYNAGSGALMARFAPYPRRFRGGVRVAVGDVTGDGVPDIVTAPGRGSRAVIEVFNGETGALENRFDAFPAQYRGGVRIAVANLVVGGPPEILVQKPGQRRIEVFNGRTGAKVGTLPGVLLPKYVSSPYSSRRGAARHSHRHR
jgi:fibronectin-binding autotransporter adhesin